MKRKALKAAFPHTIPILAGFCFLGMAYGIYMSTAGFSFVYPMCMSLLIYGGSLEFVAVEMLLSPFAPIQTFIMAVLIQARHLFYGLSMLEKFKGLGWKKFYLIFGDVPVCLWRRLFYDSHHDCHYCTACSPEKNLGEVLSGGKINVTDSTDYHHRAMRPRHHGNSFYPVYGFQRKEENAGFYPVSWQISALGGVRYAGYLLSEKCGISTGKSWSARITCNSCNRCAPCVETTDAALHCGRHHLLYAVNTFYVNL